MTAVSWIRNYLSLVLVRESQRHGTPGEFRSKKVYCNRYPLLIFIWFSRPESIILISSQTGISILFKKTKLGAGIETGVIRRGTGIINISVKKFKNCIVTLKRIDFFKTWIDGCLYPAQLHPEFLRL